MLTLIKEDPSEKSQFRWRIYDTKEVACLWSVCLIVYMSVIVIIIYLVKEVPKHANASFQSGGCQPNDAFKQVPIITKQSTFTLTQASRS